MLLSRSSRSRTSKEWVPQRVRRLDPLVRVERKAVFQQIRKHVEVLLLGGAHATRGGLQAGTEVPRWLDYG